MAPRKKPEAVVDDMDAPVFEHFPETMEETTLPIQGHALLTPDEAVRWHASVLRDAVVVAQAAGFIVSLPFDISALDRIAISATAKVL